MGHRNLRFTGHIDLETDQQCHSHLHPDPCIFYGNVANFSHPSNHTLVRAPGNQCNFNFQPMPEHNDSALFYGVRPYNGLQPQLPLANPDLAVAASTGNYNPYMAPSSDSYFCNIHNIDDVRSFKGKNAGGASSNYQHQNASASFPVAPLIARPAESDVTQMLAPPVPLPRNPWLDVHFGTTSGDVGAYVWTHAPSLPYTHAGINGAFVEAGNVGVQGYQAPTINRSAAGFLHAPIAQGHSNPRPVPPMQAFRGYNINFPSPLATPSRRIPTINSSNSGINSFHDVVDARPAFLAPVLPTGFTLFQPQRREIILDPSARQHNLPHLRVLPEDEVAVLEVPGYHEAGDSTDLHRDMRLDIDHMSYEELLALEEHIGSVGTGLTAEFIQNNLKIRTFTSSAACIDIEHATCPDQPKIDFCVICQTDYEYEENLGILDCGHEYHRECITKWLLVKNTCPVCKSTALSEKGKGFVK